MGEFRLSLKIFNFQIVNRMITEVFKCSNLLENGISRWKISIWGHLQESLRHGWINFVGDVSSTNSAYLILIGDARASTSHHRNSASLLPSPSPCFTLPISSNAKKVSASYGIPCPNLNWLGGSLQLSVRNHLLKSFKKEISSLSMSLEHVHSFPTQTNLSHSD